MLAIIMIAFISLKKTMDRLTRDFVSRESRQYKMKIGRTVASSLTGFIFGVAAASIVWMYAIQNF